MAGMTMPPAVSAGTMAGLSVGTGQQVSSSLMNSFRVTAVVDRLATHFQPGRSSDSAEFFSLCLSLSRGIDYAVANNNVPTKAPELPSLLKQVCQHGNDVFLQAAIMVLMISVKNACKFGWFSDKETQELTTLANEVGRGFCSSGDLNIRSNNPLSPISIIMARFYPRMKVGDILASLEVKPGYGAYANDFYISKSTPHTPQEKIRLFVAQTDNMDTSACIISPQQVNFLLNGKGVERRTNVLMDTGPQMPTHVTSMLKYGTNLLQAVGQFNGHYVVVVAFMSVTSSPDTPVLKDYVQSGVIPLDSDSDIIEGPSRISLNCPISYKRIKTPVKGHSCKHLQCFDFNNFVDINSRRPSWRCPHCNQHVCYTDICVDQNIVKVLKEVGENVTDVIISADGSWKAVLESDGDIDHARDKTNYCQKEGSENHESTSFSNTLPIVVDLTDDDKMDVVGTSEIEDKKPLLANLQGQSVAKNLTSPSELNSTVGINQNVAGQIEDEFWSGLDFTHGYATSSARSDTQIVGDISELTPVNFITSPNVISPALNQQTESRGNINLATSVMLSQFPAPTNMQLQQSLVVNSLVSHEYGRFPSIPRHVSRTPIAVQALPAPSQTLTPQQRSRTSMNTLIPNCSPLASPAALSVAPTANGFNTGSSDMERQQPFSRSHASPLQMPNMVSSSLQNHSTAQVSGIPASNQLSSAYRVSSALPTEHQNLHQQQAVNLRMTQPRTQSPSLIRSSPPLPRTQIHQGGAQVGVGHTAGTGNSSHASFMAAHLAVQMARRSPSVPVQNQTSRTRPSFPVNANGTMAPAGEQRGNMGGIVQAVSRADGLVDFPSEQNWQPTGRMRGSLSGRPYSNDLNQYIIRPTQPTQAVRPPSNLTSSPSGVPSHLQVLTANNRNTHVPQTQNNPMTDPSSTSGGSGILPEHHPRMN